MKVGIGPLNSVDANIVIVEQVEGIGRRQSEVCPEEHRADVLNSA